MVRRNRAKTLQPFAQPTDLVTRDRHSLPLQWQQIAAGADRRAVLEAARSEQIAAGWSCCEVGRADNGYFAERSEERLSEYPGLLPRQRPALFRVLRGRDARLDGASRCEDSFPYGWGQPPHGQDSSRRIHIAIMSDTPLLTNPRPYTQPIDDR